MKQLDIYLHPHDGAEAKLIHVAEDATVEALLKIAQQEAAVIGELEEEILLLVEEESKLVRKEHKLCDHGVKHGHHVHISKAKHIFVAVVTTSGTWPTHGYDNVPSHQPVRDELKRAANKLRIPNHKTTHSDCMRPTVCNSDSVSEMMRSGTKTMFIIFYPFDQECHI